MRIYLVRHGEPERDPRGRRYIGITDVPISDEGMVQAILLGRKLAGEEDARKLRICTSPLSRCRETAEIRAEELGCGKPEVIEGNMKALQRTIDEVRVE